MFPRNHPHNRKNKIRAGAGDDTYFARNYRQHPGFRVVDNKKNSRLESNNRDDMRIARGVEERIRKQPEGRRDNAFREDILNPERPNPRDGCKYGAKRGTLTIDGKEYTKYYCRDIPNNIKARRVAFYRQVERNQRAGGGDDNDDGGQINMEDMNNLVEDFRQAINDNNAAADDGDDNIRLPEQIPRPRYPFRREAAAERPPVEARRSGRERRPNPRYRN